MRHDWNSPAQRALRGASTVGFCWTVVLIAMWGRGSEAWAWPLAVALWAVPGGMLCWSAVKSRREDGGKQR